MNRTDPTSSSLNVRTALEPGGDAAAIVSRRRVPRVYVMDSTGDVLLRGAGEGALGAQTRKTVMALIAADSGEPIVLGLAASGEVVRLLRLSGEGRPHYALFLERIATRSPIEIACERFALSTRERAVLAALLRGASTAEIARELIIAKSTVATHVRNIGSKVHASKRKEIVAAVLGVR